MEFAKGIMLILFRVIGLVSVVVISTLIWGISHLPSKIGEDNGGGNYKVFPKKSKEE